MPIWTAYASVALFVATTAIIYPLDAAYANGERRWVHVSGLLNGGCGDSVGEIVAAGVGNFGYGVALALVGESFRRAQWSDGRLGRYWVGLSVVLAFYLVLGFPTGRGAGTDFVHHASSGVGVAATLAYATLSLDRRKHPIAMAQNLATFGMFAAGVALFATYLSGEIDKIGWNGFVAAQLAFGLSFLAFLMSWGTMRDGPDGPTKRTRD